MDAKAALAWLESAPVQRVPIEELRIDPAFQPRVERLIPLRDKGRAKHRSDEHTAALRLKLGVSRSVELEPIMVANIDGQRYVVDGHHRLKAYALEKRETISVRERPLSRRAAVLASKLVNCPDRSLEMHQEQYRESGWQWMADACGRGVTDLKQVGESYRTVSATFRIGKTTAERMWKRLATVDPKDYPEAACDPGTGFPCWKYVRQPQTPWKEMQEMLTPDQLTLRWATKAAERIAGILGDLDPDVRRLAVGMLVKDAHEHALDDCDIAGLAYDNEGRSADALLQAMQPIDEDADF